MLFNLIHRVVHDIRCYQNALGTFREVLAELEFYGEVPEKEMM